MYPFDTDDNDEEEVQVNESIRVRVPLIQHCLVCITMRLQGKIPFAVVGSEHTVIIDGKSVRGRKNRWGVVNVEDETHCEFVSLRDFLTRYRATVVCHCEPDVLKHYYRTHLQDLIETTAQIHYEAFRCRQLMALKENARPQQA